MISIRRAANELERLEEILETAKDTYGQAIRSAAEYAIEVNPVATGEFREHLANLHKQVGIINAREDWQAVQTAFRGELREFRDQTVAQVEGLRQEVKAAGAAVQLFAASVAAIDSEQGGEIQATLSQMEVIAQSEDPETLRSGIRSSARNIAGSVDMMRRRHQMAIAELRDEIRILHKQIDTERKAHFLDPATGAWNRQKLDSLLSDHIERDQPFRILLVCVRNLARLEARYPRNVVEEALRALLQRLAGILTDSTLIGRWDERTFAAILDMEQTSANAISQLATKRLSGDYTIQEDGASHSLRMQAAGGVIDHISGCDERAFRKKITQMTQALSED